MDLLDDEAMVTPGITFITSGGSRGLPGRDGKPGQDGVSGQPGRDGKDGLDGKDGSSGSGNFRWCGQWDKDTQYTPGDAVRHLNSSFICIAESLGNPPASLYAKSATQYWDVLALEGKRGPGGGNGAPGQSIVGPQGMTWEGAYNAGTTYAKNDVARYNGSSYIALKVTTGMTPDSSPLDWGLVAQKGDDGSGTGGSGINWLNAYDNATTYAVNDAVSYLGSSYIAIAAGTGNFPTDPTFWDLMAAKGSDGAPGADGADGMDGAPGADGADGMDGAPGAPGADGADGSDGAPGADGSDGVDGASAGRRWTYSSDVTPGAASGIIKFNNLSVGAINTIYLSETDGSGQTIADVIGSWDDSTSATKGQFRIEKVGDDSTFIFLSLTGTIVDSGTYDTIGVSYLYSSSGWFVDGDEVVVIFTATGDKGEVGNDGNDGAPGAPGADGNDGADGVDGVSTGVKYLWNTSTTNADPGTGKLAINNGTYASATRLYISETDNDGGGQATAIAQWDDSTSTAKGIVIVRSKATPATYIELQITGTLTDNGGWDTLVATTLASNGTFANNDPVYVEFIRTGDKGDTGTTGSTGSNGVDGRNAGIKYTFSTTTTASDPGSGFFRVNNATPSSATALYISETDGDAASLASFLATFDDGTSTIRGNLEFRKDQTAATYLIYSISGTLTDNGTWDTFTVTHVASSGTLSNNDVVKMHFTPKGDKGDTGATGSTGGTGTAGTNGRDAGVKYTYDSTTTASDPGSGKFRLNNATIASATALYISETDGDAAGIAALLATLDDSTSTVRSTITFRKQGTPANYATFQITSAITDNGTWDTFTVAYVSGNGPLVNTDVCNVEVSRTGDKGTTGNNGANGADGSNGTNGTNGRDAGRTWKYSSTTTASDPGSGFVRFNNSTLSSATAMYISETDFQAAAAAALIATWDDSTSTVKGQLLVQQQNDPTVYTAFNITGTLTDNGTWDTFTVASAGSNGVLVNNDIVVLTFARTGDLGTTGSTGSAGTNGRDSGIKYTYDSTTTASDPGSGKFRLNNATVASATALYISETDGDAAGIAALLATWDDSTTVGNRGTIIFRKQGTPANYAMFSVVSTLTDNGTWDTFTVTYISGNGPLVNTDVCNVEFIRTGDKGDTGTTGFPGTPGADGAAGRNAFRNLLFNGNMNLSQRGTTFSAVTNTQFTLDRWQWVSTAAGVASVIQLSTAADNQNSRVLQVDVTTADTSIAAGDVIALTQKIEGFNFLAAAGKTITLSFYVNCTQTGTYYVTFRNSNNTLSYVAAYTVNVANAWEKKTITLTHTTSGTWDYATGIGLSVGFTLMCGSTFQTTANAWQSGNFFAVSGTANLFSSTANNWYLAQVQLEVGSTASDFEQVPWGDELLRCQRYYETSYPPGVAIGAASSLGPAILIATSGLAASTAGGLASPLSFPYKVTKRDTPTIVLYSYDGTANAVQVYPADNKRTGCTAAVPTASGTFQFLSIDNSGTQVISSGNILNAHWTASAEL